MKKEETFYSNNDNFSYQFVEIEFYKKKSLNVKKANEPKGFNLAFKL